MESKKIKKIFNVEYDLTSEEFKAQKQDEISEKCQAKHGDMICKITTFCAKDKQLVVSTTEKNRAFMGAASKLLAHRPLAEQSFLNMDDDMVKTYEITITADTDLEDYVTAIDIAQSKADEMFEADDSKLPLVTVIDYRWGNVPATLTATVFSDVDADGNIIPLIGNTDSSANVIVGDGQRGKVVKDLAITKERILEESGSWTAFDEFWFDIIKTNSIVTFLDNSENNKIRVDFKMVGEYDYSNSKLVTKLGEKKQVGPRINYFHFENAGTNGTGLDYVTFCKSNSALEINNNINISGVSGVRYIDAVKYQIDNNEIKNIPMN